jgi:hypothetical protein
MSTATEARFAYDRIVECVVGFPAFVQLSECAETTSKTEPVTWVDGTTGEFGTDEAIYYPKDHHAYGMEEVVGEGESKWVVSF